MYFRNKFDEEFLFLADNISPKGGSVRLDNKSPNFFIIEKPPFDESKKYIVVKPLLLYNRLVSNNLNDKVVEDWIVLCENKKDTVVTCLYDEFYFSKQDKPFVEQTDYSNINADLSGEEEE